MNICFFSDVHISKFRGGVERVTNLLSEALQRKGYCITMLSVLSPTENDPLEKNQFVLPNKNVCSQQNIKFASELFKTKSIDIIINQSETLSTYKLLKESREKQALITCIHNDPATMIKAIDDQWDLWRINHGDLKYFFLYPYIYLRKILQRHFRLEYVRDKYSKHYQESDAIILLSDKYIDVFKKITRIEDCKKIHIIPNPTLFYQLNSNNEKENISKYELKLPTDSMFNKVHGEIILHYSVYKNQRIIMLDNLTPDDILTEGHQKELTTYKGVMVSKTHAQKDIFKINLLNMIEK